MARQPLGAFSGGVTRTPSGDQLQRRNLVFVDQIAAHSSNFQSGVQGWIIRADGSAEFTDVIVSSDLKSSNWDGADPADLSSSADGTATAGYYLDHSAGAAQFQKIYAEGGEIGDLDVVDDLRADIAGGVEVRFGNTTTHVRADLQTIGLSSYPAMVWAAGSADIGYIAGWDDVSPDRFLIQSVNGADININSDDDIIVEWDTEMRWYVGANKVFDSTSTSHTFYAGSEFIRITPGDEIYISTDNPEIRFEETDTSGAGENYWLHHNNGIFYLLQDRTGDGSWNSPHPWWVTTEGQLHVGVGIDIPDGSASAPGLALESDADTGLYTSGVGYLNVTVAGEEQVYFQKRSATARAATALTIKGDTSGDNLIKFETDRPWYFRQANTGSTTELWLQDGGSSKQFWIVDYNGNKRVGFDMNTTAPVFYATPVYSQTGSASNVHVDSAGKVFRQTSALKYKSNVIYYEDRLANLEIRPAGYMRKDDGSWHLGFIADDLEKQHPAFGIYDHETGELEDFERDALLAVMAAKINRLERRVEELTCG